MDQRDSSGGPDYLREINARSPAGRPWTAERVRLLALCGLMLFGVGLVFVQTAGFGYVDFDDDKCVFANRLVTGDLNLGSLWQAITERHVESGGPLACLSHMLVWHLLAHGPAAPHALNVLLHTATAVLLLVVLRQMTDRLWPSALVAALFAVHPLRAESVAWVTERKDVLSGLFFVLALGAYTKYASWSSAFAAPSLGGGPGVPSQAGAASRGRLLGAVVWYMAVMVFFALSLAAKPTGITLPFVLLLADYWPLGRLAIKPRPLVAPAVSTRSSIVRDRPAQRLVASQGATTGRDFMLLLLEKVPLLALGAVACHWTFRGQAAAIAPSGIFSWPWRIENGLISYVGYVGQLFWPAGLATCYPRRPLSLPPWQIGGSLLVLAIITGLALACWRKRPYLLVGWLWYVGMLLPVIGLVQVGTHAEADRFTYLPGIGLAIALVWTAADAWRNWRRSRLLLAFAASCLLPILLAWGWHQVSFWHDSETLWTRALARTAQNALAHNNLGSNLAAGGDSDQAIAHFKKALDINPAYLDAHRNLGVALAERGDLDGAISQYQEALTIKHDYLDARCNMGLALAKRKRLDDAMAEYRTVLQSDPGHFDAHNNLGLALAEKGQLDEAIAEYERALKSDAGRFETHYNLGIALARCGRMDEAITHYQAALTINPTYAECYDLLGKALADRGRLDEAIAHYQVALKINPNYAECYNDLAQALADSGRADEAIANYQRAVEIKSDYAEAHNNLGRALAGRAQIDEAMAHFQTALKLNPDYVEAHNNFGSTLVGRGRLDEAIKEYQTALKLDPRRFETENNLGFILARRGRINEALAHYQKALEIKPDYAEAHNNLGKALAARGQTDEAIAHFRRAVEIKPGDAEAHDSLGKALVGCGQFDEAISHFQRAVEIRPDDFEAHNYLGNTLFARGRIGEAIAHYQKTLKLSRENLDALNCLAWVRATCPEARFRDGRSAIELAGQAVRISGGKTPESLDTLAAAYAEAGMFDNARETMGKALSLAKQQKKDALVEQLRARLKLYEAGIPYREPQVPSAH